jgi:hypothetical protein
MTDVVYVLGTGSGWADNELRFSLRSLATYLTDLGTVYVVGHRPKWLTGVVHLPWPDHYPCKERNIMEKLAYACGHPDLSKKFLHVHDDHFMLAPGQAHDIPNWHAGPLDQLAAHVKKTTPGNHWGDAVANTHKALAAAGHTVHNFDVHFPMIFDKDDYPKTMDLYNWKGEPRGFVVKSLYANTLGLPGVKTSDIKLNQRMTTRELVDRLTGRPWFSVGNGALGGNLKQLFSALYPTASQFEKNT